HRQPQPDDFVEDAAESGDKKESKEPAERNRLTGRQRHRLSDGKESTARSCVNRSAIGFKPTERLLVSLTGAGWQRKASNGTQGNTYWNLTSGRSNPVAWARAVCCGSCGKNWWDRTFS